MQQKQAQWRKKEQDSYAAHSTHTYIYIYLAQLVSFPFFPPPEKQMLQSSSAQTNWPTTTFSSSSSWLTEFTSPVPLEEGE